MSCFHLQLYSPKKIGETGLRNEIILSIQNLYYKSNSPKLLANSKTITQESNTLSRERKREFHLQTSERIQKNQYKLKTNVKNPILYKTQITVFIISSYPRTQLNHSLQTQMRKRTLQNQENPCSSETHILNSTLYKTHEAVFAIKRILDRTPIIHERLKTDPLLQFPTEPRNKFEQISQNSNFNPRNLNQPLQSFFSEEEKTRKSVI